MGDNINYDLIIRGGTVIDGTGSARVRADVGVRGDRIAAVGSLIGCSAAREIDATGQVVTPGFVDLHTHLDAQVGWDPYMTSSSWHGVTTVLMGNCGVTFAPVVDKDREFLAEMMESVEDIPRDAILSGLPWDWSTYGEYLDSVERMRPALNVVGLVGHCAIRYQVMGDRAMSDEAPTAAELGRISDLVEESVAGGAVGFSTSRILLHYIPDGRYVPGTLASVDEYLAVADGMNRAGGGLFQSVNDFATKAAHEFELLRTMTEKCGDVLFSGGVGDSGGVDVWNGFLDDTRSRFGNISSAAMTRPSGTLMGLHHVMPVKSRRWAELRQLESLDQRVAALRDPTTRAGLAADGYEKGLWYDPGLVFPLGDGLIPDYNMGRRRSVADLAAAAGVHPVDWVIDRLIASEGREMFNVWFFNRNVEGLGQFLQLDAVCPGLGDAGAHAGQICDADAATHYLAYWVRERRAADLEKAVHQLTQKPASVLGLVDRGSVKVGAFADINVFDPTTVAPAYPEYRTDFPNGAGRLLIRSYGYAATIVNGEVVTEQGAHTGSRPGRVLREFSR